MAPFNRKLRSFYLKQYDLEMSHTYKHLVLYNNKRIIYTESSIGRFDTSTTCLSAVKSYFQPLLANYI